MHSQNGGAGRLNNNLKFSAGYYVMELINKSNVTDNSNKVTTLQSDILVSVNRTTDC